MELAQNEKKPKLSAKVSTYGTLRIKKETRKRLLQELAKINKKDFGRRVRADDFVALAMSRITPEDHLALQEASMSGIDRVKREHKAYVMQNGPITWDEYLWKRVSGQIPTV